MMLCKSRLKTILPILFMMFVLPLVSACTSNPATGQKQFTALMSPSQENSIGAAEHKKIKAQYGFITDQKLVSYVSEIGHRVSKNTERPDVSYKFYVIDSPIVNAFALPGGYIYASRGLLALANNEMELASVLAHETGHITARHSAERYSRGVVTSLGATLLSAVIGDKGASQALSVGSNLYIKSYSREQENEADTLGIRYLARGHYDPNGMSAFLRNLQADSALGAKVAGQKQQTQVNYFSTHPATSERIARTISEAATYPASKEISLNTAKYFKMIEGMTYGDSARQGFVRDDKFYHTDIGFTFDIPDGFSVQNRPHAVMARSKAGAAFVFDMAARKGDASAHSYLINGWMKEQPLQNVETLNINGQDAVSGSFNSNIGGKAATIRLIVVPFDKKRFARFQIAIPQGASDQTLTDLKSASYSFRKLSPAEKNTIQPYKIRIILAKKGDSVSSLAAQMPFDDYSQERFRVLNGMSNTETILAGSKYKIVSGK